jgi:hypothetical protein
MPQTKAGDKSVTAVLSGTDYVELVPPPPDRFSYKISNVFGMNTEPYSRTLNLVFNDNGTRTVIWTSAATASGIQFNQSKVGGDSYKIDIVLSEMDQKLEMNLDDSGTATIVVSYEILEA